MIKRIVMILAVLIAIVGLIGLVLPANTHVERSIVISKAPAMVFPWVNSLKKFNEWSPWSDLDPNTQYTFTGPDEGTGASMTWSSDNAAVGSGAQLITESVGDSKVVTALDFGSQGTAVATWVMTPEGDAATQVTWMLDSQHGYNLLARYFGLMLDTWVGNEYDKGLSKLKLLAESS